MPLDNRLSEAETLTIAVAWKTRYDRDPVQAVHDLNREYGRETMQSVVRWCSKIADEQIVIDNNMTIDESGGVDPTHPANFEPSEAA